jgi:malonyl-CoA O-methyltransferase
MVASLSADFDRRAPDYHRRAKVQSRTASWLAQWLPPRAEGTALELGAGTGLFTRHLVGVCDRLVATDASPRMVEAGIAECPEQSWTVAEACQPPAGDTYHWIFTCSLAQWLPDPALAFQRWRDVSAPQARMIAGWFIAGTMIDWLALCPSAAPFRWREASEWIALLGDSGWEVQRSEVKTFLVQHASAAAMLRELHDVGAVVPRRFGTGRLRSALRAWDAKYRGTEGLSTPFVFLRVEALRR